MIGCGKFFLRLVVVENDDFKAKIAPLPHRFKRGRPAINHDDNFRTVAFELFQRFKIGAVAFAQTVRNIKRHVNAEMPEKTPQQRRRRRPIDIEIPEYRDGSFLHHRLRHILSHHLHAGKGKRIGKIVFQGRIEKTCN